MGSSMKRPALAVLAGTAAMVVWGMLFWGLLGPKLGVYQTLPGAEDVTRLLQANQVQTGSYFVPWPRDTPEAFARFVAHHQAGSFYELRYLKEGVDPNSPAKILFGCFHYLTVALLAVALLLLARPRTFGKRLGLVMLAGLLGSDFITLAEPIWFHLPWDHVRAELVYEGVSWLLLGAATAGTLKFEA